MFNWLFKPKFVILVDNKEVFRGKDHKAVIQEFKRWEQDAIFISHSLVLLEHNKIKICKFINDRGHLI